MTEKEIIKQIKNDLNVGEFYGITEDSIKGLLDLYNKQKEEIKELKAITKMYDSYIGEKMPVNSNIIIADREYFMNGTFVNKFINKDKIREKIKNFKAVKQEIFRLENKLGIPSITYDIVRNDYCEKMLEDLLYNVINHETKTRFMFDIDDMHTVALLNLSGIDSNLVIE
jgi:hypothetical protein